MTVYLVAQLTFRDEERYRRYEENFFGVFSGSGGTVLVADEAPVFLQGDSPPDKVVVMSFDDAAAAEAFLTSPEYQKISVDREAGADTSALLVHALDPPLR